MSYLALYRKYRPQKFEEVVGQNKIVKILENSINNNKISHAYLIETNGVSYGYDLAISLAKFFLCIDYFFNLRPGHRRSTIPKNKHDIQF